MINSPYKTPSLIAPKTLAENERVGKEFCEFLGVNSLEEARKLDAFYIRDKYGEFAASKGNFLAMDGRFLSCIDDKFMKMNPMKAFFTGDRVKVPVMSGNTADEFLDVIFAKDDVEYEEKVKEMLENSQIDDSRIAMEVTIFADKICVDEETVRLRSHIGSALHTLEAGGSVGRKLDFIAQEMNREANTILSKANDLETSNLAIDLKTEIEKVREQIQNIE